MAKYIWVVGPPRSGTTWIGKKLANHLKAQYIHEPFHPGNQPDWSPVKYQYHTSLPTKELISYLSQRIYNKGKYLIWRLNINSIKDRAYYLKQYLKSSSKKIFVIKDPHLSLCVVDLLKNFPDSKAIWVSRNYEDHKKSLLNKGWSYSLDDLKSQIVNMPFLTDDLKVKLIGSDSHQKEEIIELGYTVFNQYLDMIRAAYKSDFIVCKYEEMLLNEEVYTEWLLRELEISSN